MAEKKPKRRIVPEVYKSPTVVVETEEQIKIEMKKRKGLIKKMKKLISQEKMIPPEEYLKVGEAIQSLVSTTPHIFECFDEDLYKILKTYQADLKNPSERKSGKRYGIVLTGSELVTLNQLIVLMERAQYDQKQSTKVLNLLDTLDSERLYSELIHLMNLSTKEKLERYSILEKPLGKMQRLQKQIGEEMFGSDIIVVGTMLVEKLAQENDKEINDSVLDTLIDDYLRAKLETEDKERIVFELYEAAIKALDITIEEETTSTKTSKGNKLCSPVSFKKDDVFTAADGNDYIVDINTNGDKIWRMKIRRNKDSDARTMCSAAKSTFHTVDNPFVSSEGVKYYTDKDIRGRYIWKRSKAPRKPKKVSSAKMRQRESDKQKREEKRESDKKIREQEKKDKSETRKQQQEAKRLQKRESKKQKRA